MRTFKRSSLVAALVVLCGALSAQAQELVIWNRTASAAETAALKKIMADFEAANPGVTVKMETRSVDEHKSALRIASTSRQGPDLYYMWTGLGLGGEYVKAGLSAPLDEYYKKYNWTARIRPIADAYTNLYPPGKHGVPYQINGEAIYFNKELFKKAGIDAPPASYADLVAAAGKLKAAGIPAITFGGSVNWHVMRLMDAILETQCGAKTHDALKAMTVKWSETPCATTAFNEFHKWTSDYMLKPFMSFDQAQSRKLFEAGRAAMMLEGDWMVSQLRNETKDAEAYGVFPFPTGTGRLYGFGVNLYMSPYSKNKDLAAKFLDYFISDKVQQDNLGAFGAIGVNKNVVYKEPKPLDTAWVDIFAKYNASFVNGDQGFPLDVTTEYFRVINSVASDQLPPAQAATTLQAFIDKRKPS
ncbi:raffinose/stachyose/melibiose transport system substrate-binding protein [Variovorax sp. HW608]|uniref:ABC transporter substrate-binding protein n=1 Tax=Variovorax sp. HW608 TaxID=1034889 RepID=UPI00081FB911|nr:ABC transporter substrate-binding protein [Variovorax sp. HW608]SCK54553.1 raffinose/stachyose/melibiose transport system substrate-binding protein [Variovorax sp. HW608]